MEWTGILLVFLLGGFVKGVVGVGMPTIVVALLSFVMPPAQAAALLTASNIVTNVVQATGAESAALLRRLWPMLAALLVATVVAMPLLRGLGEVALVVLGIALVANGALGLTAARFVVTRRQEAWLGPLAGAATGLLTAMTGVFVLPSVPYLQALGLEKDALVRAMGLTFLAATVAFSIALWRVGAWNVALATGSLIALAPALAGQVLGARARGRMSVAAFRRCFQAALVALGLALALKPLF